MTLKYLIISLILAVSIMSGCGGGGGGNVNSNGTQTIALTNASFVLVSNVFPDMTSIVNFPDVAMPNVQGQILWAGAVDMLNNGQKLLVLSVGKMRGPGLQSLPDRSKIFVLKYGNDNQFHDVTGLLVENSTSFDGVGAGTIGDINGDGKPDIVFMANEDDGRTNPGSLMGAQAQALVSGSNGMYKLVPFGDVGVNYFNTPIGNIAGGTPVVSIVNDQSYIFNGVSVGPITLNMPEIFYATGFAKINGSNETNFIATATQYPYVFGRQAYVGSFETGWTSAGQILLPYPIVAVEQIQNGSQISTSHVYNFNGTYLSGEYNGNAFSDSCVIQVSPNANPIVLFTMASSVIPNYIPGQIIDASKLTALTKILGTSVVNGSIIDATPNIVGEKLDVNLRNMICTDINSDGYDDIIMQVLANGISDVSPIIYLNNKQGGFVRSKYYQDVMINSGSSSSYLEGAIVGDFNGDQIIDIVTFPSIFNDVNQLSSTFRFFKGLKQLIN
jgi:hypothetical protein